MKNKYLKPFTKLQSITIQKVQSEAIQELINIGKQTFSDTFSSTNSKEDMDAYLEKKFSIEKISEELNDRNSAFFFAKETKNIVGYLKLNFGNSQTELKDKNAVEIERIYVLKEFHGKKVGQILYEKAVEIANEKNADYLWLGVWEENGRAIHFYKKNGFQEFNKHVFKLGNDEQIDIMMKLNLK